MPDVWAPLEERVTDELAYKLALVGIREAEKIPMAARLYPETWHNYTDIWDKLAAVVEQHNKVKQRIADKHTHGMDMRYPLGLDPECDRCEEIRDGTQRGNIE